MSEPGMESQQSRTTGGVFSFLWQRKVWWLLPLVVFLLLIGIIYVLARLSSADPEMYPTTLQSKSSIVRAC